MFIAGCWQQHPLLFLISNLERTPGLFVLIKDTTIILNKLVNGSGEIYRTDIYGSRSNPVSCSVIGRRDMISFYPHNIQWHERR